jgi:cytochrome c553
MKLIRLKIAILAIVFFVVPALAGDVASVRNCTWCHGESGQGYATAPRLAGQRQQYIQSQLWDFRKHTRDNPFSRQYMWGAAANVGPQTVRDLANYFSALTPKAANDGDRDIAAVGQAIYQEGMPDSNIVACVACHGPNAEGIAGIPRLAGLSFTYLKRRLQQWGEGYSAAAAPPMPGIAGKLSANDIDALASYLSFMK